MAKKRAKKLTVKQQLFVDAYNGNATDAARKAGYKGSNATLGAVGAENLRKPQIAEAIANRQAKRSQPLIASREQRQAFWTRVMLGKEKEHVLVEGADVELAPKLSDRLRAAELLGKSEGDFLHRMDVTTDGESLKPNATEEAILAKLLG